MRHEKTFNNSRTFDRNYQEPRFEAVSQPVEPVLVEKDGRSKVLASPPRIEEKYVTLERIDRPPGIISITAQFKNYRFTKRPYLAKLKSIEEDHVISSYQSDSLRYAERSRVFPEPSQFGETASIATTRTNFSKYVPRDNLDQTKYHM